MKILLNNLKFIFRATIQYDKILLFFLIINNFVMLVQIILPIILPQYIVDGLIQGKAYRTVLWYIFLFAVGTIVTSSATYLLKSAIYVRSMTLRFKLIIESGKKFLTMKYMNFEDPNILDLSERGDRATENNASGIEGILHRFANYGGNLLTFLVLMVLILQVNLGIALLCLLLLAITYIISFQVGKYEKKVQDGLTITNRKWDYIIGILSDVGYYKDIFIFQMQTTIFGKLSLLGEKKRDGFKKISNRNNLRNNIFSLLLAVQQIAIYAVFSTLVFNQTISIGEYTMYVAAVATFYTTAKQTIDDSVFILYQNEYINDFRTFLNLDIDDDRKEFKPLPKEIETISLKNVSFRYYNQTVNTLNDISVTFKKNEKIAIVGLNGAGKTTLIKLLVKLYEPKSGAIYINNTNIADIKREDLYSQFSTVFQEPNLFAFTLAENISLRPLSETDIDRAMDCLDQVGLSDMVKRLPKGIMQPVLKIIDEDGVEFSGGELQKISLARALYKDAPIMILDEPTASYDALAEERIYKMFHTLTQNKTVFYISHRLASTRFCDRVLLLEDGRIVEQGSHASLINQGGKYAALFQTQSQYYKVEGI